METIRIYLTLFATSIKARMEYKASFLFYIFAIMYFLYRTDWFTFCTPEPLSSNKGLDDG
jgi:hypothetical protein